LVWWSCGGQQVGEFLEVDLVAGRDTRKSIRAGSGPGLKKACGQSAGTNMKLPGPPRNTVAPVADFQVRQSLLAVAAGWKASRSSSPSST
jgi:hypothetical protein